MRPSNTELIGAVMRGSLFTGLLSLWTRGPEVLLAYNLGARSVALGYLWVGILLLIAATVASYWVENEKCMEMAAVTILVFVAYLHRHGEAWESLKHGTENRNTFFMGYSVLLFLEPVLPRPLHWLLDEWTAYRVVHPLIMIVLGLAVLATGGSLVVTIWAVGGGLLLAVKNAVLYGFLIGVLLDRYDSALSRYHLPRLLDDRSAETRTHDHAGMPVTPTLINILHKVAAPTPDEIVRQTMSSNGTEPSPQQMELPYE